MMPIVGLAFLIAVIGLFVFGIRSFFGWFDVRMKQRLADSTTSGKHEDEEL